MEPRRASALARLRLWERCALILLVLLFVAGVWIVLQPMQMRGTMQGVG